MFNFTVETAATPEQAIADLTESLKVEGFGVLWELDMRGKLAEKGVEFDRDYYIIEVCNPAEAKRVLTENPLVGYFLPCKMAIYEENGKTKMGMPKPTVLMGNIESKALMEIASNIEKRLIACIENAVK
ncbi:DUF302 domain-containing protein [Paenibacillus nasutitermitis]|uniref:DUF302 domain-containing protein n=1 Tax=Paenibacillus nasutitermitis TaxID=1652958 RepID=A0A916YKB9_9BACL|nr:DUF302 domain-containing protein [Paenibacillus nasutitermitis]GGD48423.1 hypothetical protein GCM10010911_02410 [Paenibacillus nasutitermitis]